jgi:hypothetical protein
LVFFLVNFSADYVKYLTSFPFTTHSLTWPVQLSRLIPTLPSLSGPRFPVAYTSALILLLHPHTIYSFTLKMEAIHSFETLAPIYPTPRCDNPEHSHLRIMQAAIILVFPT